MDFLTESPRICRRLVGLSQTAMADSSSCSQYSFCFSAGGLSPRGSSKCLLLNQSTLAAVANSTSSTFSKNLADGSPPS